jgi:hypothetical protein
MKGTSKTMKNIPLILSAERIFSEESGDSEIMVYPILAMILGVTNSICLDQLDYRINKETNNNIFDGRKWICKSYKQWHELLPFFAEVTIKRSFLEMEKMGLVLSRKGEVVHSEYHHKVKYYSIDYEVLERLLKEA